MKNLKKSMLVVMSVMMLGNVVIPVQAEECEVSVTYVDSSGVAEFTGDPFYNPITGKQIKGIFDSYDLTADKDSEQANCMCEMQGGYDFQCTGWVDIVDKKSGTDLKHSTTAALSNPSSGDMYKGAVKQIGYGKVYARSEWVHGWAVPRIFGIGLNKKIGVIF